MGCRTWQLATEVRTEGGRITTSRTVAGEEGDIRDKEDTKTRDTTKTKAITKTSITSIRTRISSMVIGGSSTMTKEGDTEAMIGEEVTMVMGRETTGLSQDKGDITKLDGEVTTNKIKRVWPTHLEDLPGKKAPSV